MSDGSSDPQHWDDLARTLGAEVTNNPPPKGYSDEPEAKANTPAKPAAKKSSKPKPAKSTKSHWSTLAGFLGLSSFSESEPEDTEPVGDAQEATGATEQQDARPATLDAPSTDAPSADTPSADTPSADAPSADAPGDTVHIAAREEAVDAQDAGDTSSDGRIPVETGDDPLASMFQPSAEERPIWETDLDANTFAEGERAEQPDRRSEELDDDSDLFSSDYGSPTPRLELPDSPDPTAFFSPLPREGADDELPGFDDEEPAKTDDEEQPRRRRRRRGRRRGRRRSGERSPESPPDASSTEFDEPELVDEPFDVADSGVRDDETRTEVEPAAGVGEATDERGRRSHSRRRGRRPPSDQASEGSRRRAGRRAEASASDAGPAASDGEVAGEPRRKVRKFPSWGETVGYVIDLNLSTRNRRSDSGGGGGRRRRGGRRRS